jgi:Fe-S oxidoreductase
MNDKVISYQPTEGLTYDPSDPKYYDKQGLDGEIRRVFEVCHGCRMCFKYCDSFPLLFGKLDKERDGDVRKLTQEDIGGVMDACFQCKLCEVQCPYTPRDHHAYQLDFPKLVHRWRANDAREHGIPLREQVLSHPDGAASLARMSLGLADVMNRNAVQRWFMEKLLGVHRKAELPPFARQSFSSWAERADKVRAAPPAELVLFETCYVENNEPDIGKDALEVFAHNGVDVACVRGLGCCGMPAWENGDLETLRRMAKKNLDVLMPFVESGSKVVVINPTCSMMMRREYAELLAEPDRERAKRLRAAVADAGEFLWSIKDEQRFSTDFKSTPGPIAYHAPCHLRAQGVGFKGRDLLRKIPGVTVSSTIECSGHDGTYAMKLESFEASKRIGTRAFDSMQQNAEAEVWATECPLAALQFGQHAGKKALHPLTILARAYRPDGFPKPVERTTTAKKEEP